MKGLSSLETYSRDAQAAPLREYEGMMEVVRCGTYVPDATRSGLMVQVQTLGNSLSSAVREDEGGASLSMLEKVEDRLTANDGGADDEAPRRALDV